MSTEGKVTEILCIADVFCKVFDAQMAKYTLRQKESASITVKAACQRQNHGDNDSLSFIRVSLLEAFLSRKGM